MASRIHIPVTSCGPQLPEKTFDEFEVYDQRALGCNDERRKELPIHLITPDQIAAVQRAKEIFGVVYKVSKVMVAETRCGRITRDKKSILIFNALL